MGHTHEDVDQLFSRIGDEIRRSGSESLPGTVFPWFVRTMYMQYITYILVHSTHTHLATDLMDVIARSSTPNPITAQIHGVWDVKELLQKYLNPMDGHSKYGVFKFTLTAAGHAEMQYKTSSDSPWKPGLQLTSVNKTFRNIFNLIILCVLS